METVMSNEAHFRELLRNYQGLTPQEQDAVRQRVIHNAEAMRAEMIRSLFRRLVAWVRRRKAVAELQSLDDHMLKDIGISRGEIEHAVHGRARDRVRPAPVNKRRSMDGGSMAA